MIKKILLSFITCLVILFWLFQGSINNYWSTNYTTPSPLEKLNKYKIWKLGEEINNKILTAKNFLSSQYAELGNSLTAGINSKLQNPQQASNKEANNNQQPTNNVELANNNKDDFKDLIEAQEAKLQPDPHAHVLDSNKFAIGTLDIIAGNDDYTLYSFPQEISPITLEPGDQVLIAGDSMQQGVGRHIRAYLSQNYKIQSKDLSKQSTGLLNPNNLNWNQTITRELNGTNNYKLLIMFLGANDNYGMYDSVSGKALPFGSQKWKAHYLQRIMSIMYQARIHGVQVIWVTVPNIRKKDLNDKIHLLNELYISAAKQYGVIVVDANKALGLDDYNFSPSIRINNRLVKTRSDDGIHFTIPGEKLIANAVLSNIIYKNQEANLD
ncbi:SGNH/GDSL hydrolase family protein [Psittacicella gerlachiana]|uniref:SGNH hydrolase-type esterase domain-containing protein n=1 Tax=Psittacicella gerlachiana TaxID=2028574 RepID=A0A3A1YEJ1_9GAMM|nr:DUF459 domain-containing protein [Psittacicella gerlachiana]RIY34624.1 hypothetical protein CKF59_05230 [Psittacicella gerlachiana]